MIDLDRCNRQLEVTGNSKILKFRDSKFEINLMILICKQFLIELITVQPIVFFKDK